MKPKIAIFSLTGCEGCSLAILELEDQLLDVLGAVDVVNFREGMTERSWDVDIGFVDGAVTTQRDEEEAVRFRESCKTLVAIGACACQGGINTLKNYQNEADCRSYVYGDRNGWFPGTPARPLSAVVKVDHELPGCPMVKEEFLRFVKCQLLGHPFRLPADPVCVECKRRGILCLYEQGETCLGPITRGGCDAICPGYGAHCEGCRGVLDGPELAAFGQNIRARVDVSLEAVLASARLYGAIQSATLP